MTFITINTSPWQGQFVCLNLAQMTTMSLGMAEVATDHISPDSIKAMCVLSSELALPHGYRLQTIMNLAGGIFFLFEKLQ